MCSSISFHTIKTVKIDGEEVELDKNGQYTISKIKGLYKLEVETEKVADANMTISVQYVLDDNAGTVVKSEKPAKMTADKGEDYVTVHGTVPEGYTLVSAAEQYVTFVANGSATVKFTPWLVFSVLLLMMYTHLNNLSSWGLMDLSCRPPTCTPMRRRNSRNVVPRCSVFVSGSKHGSFVLIIVHAHNSNRP